MTKFGEFWRQKMRAHFRRLDTNQDGVLTRKDFEDMADRYEHLDRQTKEKGRQMRAALLNCWDECFGDVEKVQPITVEVYIEAVINLGLEKLGGHNQAIEACLFDIMDVNNDGFISPEEFKFWFKVVAPVERYEELTKETFRAIDVNHDNKLSREEYMAAHREFFTGEDDHSPFKFLWGPLI